MKLWLIEQDFNNGYDTYDNAVVAAENEEAAKDIYPGTGPNGSVISNSSLENRRYSAWASNENVRATYLGEAREGMPAGVVCSSFNAG